MSTDSRAREGDALDRYVLTLYVAGETPRARRAIDTLKRLCDEELVGCELDVVDVLQHPELAENERILATPTLIKKLPPPLRRLIGDLSNREKVLLGLDVRVEADGETATEA